MLKAATERGNASVKGAYGSAEPWLVEAGKTSGLNLEGMTHVVDTSAVRHIFKNHGNPKVEATRGQVAVTAEDLARIPDIVADPDRIVLGTTTKLGRDQIGYLKRMEDGSTLYLEEVRASRHDLAAVSMRKYPATTNADAITSTLRPNGRADGGDAIKIIDQPARIKEAPDARSGLASSAGGGTPGDLGQSGGGRIDSAAPGSPAVAAREGSPGQLAKPNIAPTAADPNQPTFEPSMRDAGRAADAAYRDRMETFGEGAVGRALARDGRQRFERGDAIVPEQFFYGRSQSFADIQALLKANPDALPTLVDYAAMSLKRAAAPDGVIEPGKFEAWKARHRDALRALPAEARAQFEDAAKAGQAVAEASVKRLADIKAAEKQAADEVAAAVAARKSRMSAAERAAPGRLAAKTEPQDIVRTVGTILRSNNGQADMKALMAAAKGNPAATAGVRQAVTDFLVNEFMSNTLVGGGEAAAIKADAYQTFVRKNRAALAEVYSPEELGWLDRIAKDIQQAKRSENGVKNPGGSNTVQDTFAVARGAALKKGARSFLTLVAGGTGMAAGGWASALAGVVGAEAVQAFRMVGVNRIDDLVARAILDPEVARELLKTVPVGRNEGVNRSLVRGQYRDLLRALNRSLPVATAANASTDRRNTGGN